MAKFEFSSSSNYRDVLKELQTSLLKEGMSKRKTARLLGFGSARCIDMIIMGHRNLSPRSARRMAKLLNLEPRRAQAFVQLVSSQNARWDVPTAEEEHLSSTPASLRC